MSDTTTIQMLGLYSQMAAPTMFLSGMFQTPAVNFHESEEVEIDIVRSDEDISIAITDVSTGYRYNSEDLSTNKGFKPAIHKEAVPLNAFDLLNREPGSNPFSQPSFQAKATARAFRAFTKIERKIRRSIELQASQVLQTGVVTLKDANGVDQFTLNFNPKATHFPTTANPWGAAGEDPAGDILALANVVRNDGLSNPDQLIMGENAFENFIKNDDIQKRFDNRRFELGRISPMQMNGEGGIFRGVVEIGNYKYDVWTYGGRYKDPQTGNKVQYMDADKVIVRDSTARMDGTFGAIPRFAPPDSRAMPFLPERMSLASNGIDMFVNGWLTPDGEQLFVGVGARPLMIPTAIDTYGCLTTQ